jgi:NADPH:quinone reductase-like Zn-dependent oxidoreductase
MRAATLGDVPGTPEVTEVETPRPQAGELLVRVEASSVNGFDVATAAGLLQGMMEHRSPLIPGKDFAGTVEAVGAGVEGFAVGDAVFGVVSKPYLGTGSLAQYVTVATGHGVTKLPEGLSARDAGALGLAGTAAWDTLAALGPIEGKTVLISGATGGVGAFAMQLAVARGAHVIATARPGAEADFVAGLTDGDVQIVDYSADLEGEVRTIAPAGVDAVAHLAGDETRLVALVRDGGALATTLGALPETPEGRDVKAVSVMADPAPTTLAQLAGLAATGALKVPVTTVYDLERTDAAFAAFVAGTVGKIAISCA